MRKIMMTEGMKLLQENYLTRYESGEIPFEDAQALERELIGGFDHAVEDLAQLSKDPQVTSAERAEILHEVLDVLRDRFDKAHALSKEIACKRGCAACCHILVGVTRDEAALIAREIRLGHVQVNPVQLHQQAEAETLLPPEEYIGHACSFLDPRTRECRIYQHRPGACRNYRVLFKSSGCGGPANTRVATFPSPLAEAMLSAAYHTGEVDGLATLVQQELARGLAV